VPEVDDREVPQRLVPMLVELDSLVQDPEMAVGSGQDLWRNASPGGGGVERRSRQALFEIVVAASGIGSPARPSGGSLRRWRAAIRTRVFRGLGQSAVAGSRRIAGSHRRAWIWGSSRSSSRARALQRLEPGRPALPSGCGFFERRSASPGAHSGCSPARCGSPDPASPAGGLRAGCGGTSSP